MSSLRLADLASFDQLHAGLLDATCELALWADIQARDRVLDIGAGLGGPARFMAQEHGCAVTAIELSPDLDASGRALTKWLDLEEKIEHWCGDFLGWVGETRFDVIMLQHTDFHMEHKTAVYKQCRDALKPVITSRVIWHDWLIGPGGELVYPVPWSDEGEDITFLSTMDEFRANLVAAGLALHRFQPLPAETSVWFNASRDGIRKVLEKDKVEHRGRLEALLEEVEGVLRNLAEMRLIPFFAEARRVE